MDSKKKSSKSELTPEMIEEMAQRSAENFGKPETMIDPETGGILMLNGKVTEFGRKFFRMVLKAWHG
jgi:hypothetical protein